MIQFALNDHPYIELNKLLKLLHLTQSGGQANEFIVNGKVLVNNSIEIQKRKKLRVGDIIQFNGNEIVIK